MKKLISAVFAAAMITSPLVVRADQAGGLPPPDPAAFQAMEQAHAKMEQLHTQARLSVLNTLSPAQRNSLAQVVGQLAIAPNPDVAAAAKQLDAMLSPAQAKTILGIHTSLRQQAEQVMEAAHRQAMSSMPAGGATHERFFTKHVEPGGAQGDNDAGMVLLMLASSSMGEFHHMGEVMYIRH